MAQRRTRLRVSAVVPGCGRRSDSVAVALLRPHDSHRHLRDLHQLVGHRAHLGAAAAGAMRAEDHRVAGVPLHDFHQRVGRVAGGHVLLDLHTGGLQQLDGLQVGLLYAFITYIARVVEPLIQITLQFSLELSLAGRYEKFTDFGDAVRQLNASAFGLQAGVFTNDVANAFTAFNEIEVGGVILNDVPTYRIDHMPYGGVKDSGLGREGLRYAIEDMTEIRILVVAQPG